MRLEVVEIRSIDDTRARHAPALVDLRSFSTSCLATFVDVDLGSVNGETAADRSGGRLIDDGSSSRWCARFYWFIFSITDA